MKEEQPRICISTISNSVTHNGGVECLDDNNVDDSESLDSDNSVEYNADDGGTRQVQHIRTGMEGETQSGALYRSKEDTKPTFDIRSHHSELKIVDVNYLSHHHGPSLFDCDHGCFDNTT